MIKKLIVFIILSLAFLSCSNDSEKARILINQSIAELYKNENTLAKQHLLEASALDTNQAEPYYYLGIIAFDEKDYGTSMKLMDKAISKNPSYGEAFRSKAQIYFMMGDRINACKNYRLAEKYGIQNLANNLKYCP